MELFMNPPRSAWAAITTRTTEDNKTIRQRVEEIIGLVRDGGDDAIKALTREIDGLNLTDLLVSGKEFDQSAKLVAQPVMEAIRIAAANISSFHRAQLSPEVDIQTVEGVRCVQRPVPISRVGLYIPGGSAPLFSTVLMLALPAKIAGCKEIIMCTPTNRQGNVAPSVLYAARYCGVDKVFKVGGAQAIAAMAYGTESIPRVDKIFGPGNRYVTLAKQLVGLSQTAIDMPAGPSEVMVLADQSAVPEFVAADLLSQAEHGADSQVMLVCLDKEFADRTVGEVERQRKEMARNPLIERSLANSRVIVFEDTDSMIRFANAYAPEHLILAMKDPWRLARQITAAGSVFIGNYSPESAGDYASGTNHTLPTAGWARSFSGVHLDSYMRKITYQELSPLGLKSLAQTIITMAQAEGLDAHANAVRVRMDNDINCRTI